MNRYRKTIAAVITNALGFSAVVIASPAAAITATEWQFGAVGLATALGVYVVANDPA